MSPTSSPGVAFGAHLMSPLFAVKNALTLWILSDGKPGHENQSLGLADALGRRVPCEVHRISLAGKRGLVTRVKSALSASAEFPKPDLILGAGHATHPSLLWLARKHGARSIVLMRPSLPMAWFDLCIVPSHDFQKPALRKNLLISRGALNRVAPPASGEKSGGLILIGGPSKTHGWDGKNLLTALAETTRNGDWELTDSRRTPAEFLDEVRRSQPTIQVYSHQETTPEWLPGKLAAAAEVWVTEDSVSMIYESLSSGAKVGLLPVPAVIQDARVLRGVEELVTAGFLTRFSSWEKSRTLAMPPETLREADRCAAEVLVRLAG